MRLQREKNLMTKQDSINEIINCLGDAFVVDQDQVAGLLIKTKAKIFLDTCFVSKLHSVTKEELLTGFRAYAEEHSLSESDVIFVITSMILYELKEGEKNQLDSFAKQLLEFFIGNGFRVVILKEEDIPRQIRKYINSSTKEYNKEFVHIMRDCSISLTRLSKRIKSDKSLSFQDILEMATPIPQETNFVEKYLMEIKELKMNKDSLAEELISISILMYSKIWNLQKKTNPTVIICTNDYDAAIRMQSSFKAGLDKTVISFKKIYAFTLVQYLIQKEVLTDVENSKEIMKKMVGEEVLVLEKEEPPYGTFDTVEKTDSIVERIFNGENISFFAKNIKKS